MTAQPESEKHAHGRWLTIARVAWAIAALLALGLFIASLPGYLSCGFCFTTRVDAPAEFVSTFNGAIVFASIMCAFVSLVLAAVLFLRKSQDGMAMFVSFYLLAYGIIMAGPLDALESLQHSTGSLSYLAQTVLLTTPTLALFSLFPNGRFVPRWTRGLTLSVVLLPAIILYSSPDEWRTLSTPITRAFGLAMGGLLIAGLYAQIHRYRNVSTPAERQQTKWVVFGLCLWWGLDALSFVPYYYYGIQLPAGTPQPWFVLIGGAAWYLSLNSLPLSLTFAITRYRLFDIDIIIRRTLIYSVLTGALALVYFGSVILLQGLFRAVTRQQSELAIILSTLAIAALFNPLRRRVQDGIDRRFYRRRYDAAKVITAFSATVRDEVDLDKLSERLLEVVEETMQPAHVSLWLKKMDVQRKE